MHRACINCTHFAGDRVSGEQDGGKRGSRSTLPNAVTAAGFARHPDHTPCPEKICPQCNSTLARATDFAFLDQEWRCASCYERNRSQRGQCRNCRAPKTPAAAQGVPSGLADNTRCHPTLPGATQCYLVLLGATRRYPAPHGATQHTGCLLPNEKL